MRYSVGESLWVVGIRSHYICKNVHRINTHFTAPVPSVFKIDDLNFREITIKEHHKVPVLFGDPEDLKYDGFIAEDSDGNTWFNQYPTACYGQMDDTPDGDFCLSNTTELYDSNESDIEEFERELNNNGLDLSMYSLTRLLSDIDGGIIYNDDKEMIGSRYREGDSCKGRPDVGYFTKIVPLRDYIVSEFKKATGLDIKPYFDEISSDTKLGCKKWKIITENNAS